MNDNVRYWMLNGERGMSADAIVSKMENITISSIWRDAHPSDPSDFNRCVKLLNAVPEYKSRMDEMKEVSPQWKQLVEKWVELEQMLNGALETGVAPDMYDRMKEIGC